MAQRDRRKEGEPVSAHRQRRLGPEPRALFADVMHPEHLWRYQRR